MRPLLKGRGPRSGEGILYRLLAGFRWSRKINVGQGLAPAVFNWTGFTAHLSLRDTFCSAADGNPSVCFADISPNRGVSSRGRLMPSGNPFLRATTQGRPYDDSVDIDSRLKIGQGYNLSVKNQRFSTAPFAQGSLLRNGILRVLFFFSAAYKFRKGGGGFVKTSEFCGECGDFDCNVTFSGNSRGSV